MKNISTQTDNDNPSDLYLLDAPIGMESTDDVLIREGKIVDEDLLAVLHKIDLYKFVSSDNLLNWMKSADSQKGLPALTDEEIIAQVRENDGLFQVTDCLEDRLVSSTISTNDNDNQPLGVNNSHVDWLPSTVRPAETSQEEQYISSSFELLYGV